MQILFTLKCRSLDYAFFYLCSTECIWRCCDSKAVAELIRIIKKCIILKSVCLHFPHLCIQCNNCSAHLKWPCRLWDWLNVDTCWCWLANIDQSAERWRVKRADILNMVYALWLPVTRIASVQPSSLFEKRVSPRRAGHPYGGRKKRETLHPSAVCCPDLT